MASLGVRTLDELIGRTDLLEVDGADRPLEGARGRPHARPALPRAARGRAAPPRQAAAAGARRPPRLGAAARRPRWPSRPKQPRRSSTSACATSTAASAACCSSGSPSATAPRACRRTRSRSTSPARPGQSLRRLAGAGRHLHAARRRQRLHGQGPVAAACSPCCRRDGVTFAAEENVIVGNTVLYGATERQGVLPRPRGRALRRAQLGRQRRRRGRRRPRLRVHDRRARRRARRDRAQLRRGHERRPGLRPRRGRRVPRAASTRRCSTSSSRSTRATRSRSATLVAEHVQRTGLAGRRSACSTTGTTLLPTLRQGLPDRLQARAGRAGARRPRPSRRGRRLMGELGGFLKIERSGVAYDDPTQRIEGEHDLQGVPRPAARTPSWPRRARAAWSAACRSATTAARWATSSPTGTTSSTATAGTTRSASCTRRTTSPSSPAGCARRRARPRACSRSARATRSRSSRSRTRSSTARGTRAGSCPQPPRRRDRPQRRRRRRRARPGMAAAQQLRRAGHRVVLFERDEAAGGLVRFGVPDFKIEKRVVERRVEQLARRGRRAALRRRRRRRRHRRRAARASSTRSCWRSARACRATCRSRAASSTASTSRWSTSTCATARSPARSDRAITAEGKHVVVIGGGDTGADCVGNSIREGAASVVQLELLPEPPAHRPDDRTPWPLWPQKFRLSYAMEEARAAGRGEQDFSVVTTHFEGDGDGRVHKLHYAQAEPAPPFEPVEGTEGELRRRPRAARDGLPAPAARRRRRPARRREGPARQRQGADVRDVASPGVFAAGDARRGQSLIVWAINEGRQCARMVDRYLKALDDGSGRAMTAGPGGDADEGPAGPPRVASPAL